MRIIAGVYKGRRLKTPRHEGLRPTADRVKEALYNIIGPRITGATLLDLFAGTGGIGIEALSRGAATVVFADCNPASLRLVRENLAMLPPHPEIRVLPLDAEQAIRLLSREQCSFDLIFLDPPFEAGLLPRTMQTIHAAKLLAPEGWLIAEHSSRTELEAGDWRLFEKRVYGEITLSFFGYAV
jgi:16S rRNA (guanine966-N2)-methyltransferase